MREIKFRAWNKEFKKYIGSSEYVFDPYNGEVGELSGYEILAVNHNAVIEQFTGLRDKNGKEVYEGDVVEFPSKRGTINFMGIVVYEKFCFNIEGFYDVFYDYPSLAFSEGNNYEVIGNIHENPELLEEK